MSATKDWQLGVTEGIVTELPTVRLVIPYPGSIPRQRAANSAHGSVELRAHCTPREFAYITETAKLVGLQRASIVRWFTLYGSRATRAYLDGKDDDPNPS
jgi:hypothetical protein